MHHIETKAHEVISIGLRGEVKAGPDNDTRTALLVMLVDKGFSAFVLMHYILESNVIDFELNFPVNPFAPHLKSLVALVISSLEESDQSLGIQEFFLIVIFKRGYLALCHDINSFFEIPIGLRG